MDDLRKIVRLLESDGKPPDVYRPHKLKGGMAGLWECHIRPDWLLIWQQKEDACLLVLMSTSTHSDLFKK